MFNNFDLKLTFLRIMSYEFSFFLKCDQMICNSKLHLIDIKIYRCALDYSVLRAKAPKKAKYNLDVVAINRIFQRLYKT